MTTGLLHVLPSSPERMAMMRPHLGHLALGVVTLPGPRRSARGAAAPTIPRSGIVASWLDILREGTWRRRGQRRTETRV